MEWILKKKRNGSSRLTEAASFSVIIWDKGFTKPVQEQTIVEEEAIASSSFSVPVEEAAEEAAAANQPAISKGFGK